MPDVPPNNSPDPPDGTPPTPSDAHPTLGTSQVPGSYYKLMEKVVSNPDLTGDEKKQILRALARISPSDDRLTYRFAIILLGIIALLSVGAIWALSKAAPEGLIAIASGAVGGLAGLLSASKSSGNST